VSSTCFFREFLFDSLCRAEVDPHSLTSPDMLWGGAVSREWEQLVRAVGPTNVQQEPEERDPFPTRPVPVTSFRIFQDSVDVSEPLSTTVQNLLDEPRIFQDIIASGRDKPALLSQLEDVVAQSSSLYQMFQPTSRSSMSPFLMPNRKPLTRCRGRPSPGGWAAGDVEDRDSRWSDFPVPSPAHVRR
jgi:hypothetical protein